MISLGCRVTPSIYTDIEERWVLPTEPERFFEAAVIALDLCEHECFDLLYALAYSVLAIELGEEFTRSVIPDGEHWLRLPE
jgi:hypothetical protein